MDEECGAYSLDVTRRRKDDGRGSKFGLGSKKLQADFFDELGIPSSAEGGRRL